MQLFKYFKKNALCKQSSKLTKLNLTLFNFSKYHKLVFSSNKPLISNSVINFSSSSRLNKADDNDNESEKETSDSKADDKNNDSNSNGENFTHSINKWYKKLISGALLTTLSLYILDKIAQSIFSEMGRDIWNKSM